jgi:hypothetical protein
MSLDYHYYMGPYVKVWLPDRTYTSKIRTCTNTQCKEHGKYTPNSFCSTCGSSVADCTLHKTGKMNLHDFFEEELGNVDIFQAIHIEDHPEYGLVLPNQRDQGGINIEEPGTYNLPDMAGVTGAIIDEPTKIGGYFDQKDWKLLIDKLNEKKITYAPQIGLVHYIR